MLNSCWAQGRNALTIGDFTGNTPLEFTDYVELYQQEVTEAQVDSMWNWELDSSYQLAFDKKKPLVIALLSNDASDVESLHMRMALRTKTIAKYANEAVFVAVEAANRVEDTAEHSFMDAIRLAKLPSIVVLSPSDKRILIRGRRLGFTSLKDIDAFINRTVRDFDNRPSDKLYASRTVTKIGSFLEKEASLVLEFARQKEFENLHPIVNWYNDLRTALKVSRERNLPLVVLFVGKLGSSPAPGSDRLEEILFSSAINPFAKTAVFCVARIALPEETSTDFAEQVAWKMSIKTRPTITILECDKESIRELDRLVGEYNMEEIVSIFTEYLKEAKQSNGDNHEPTKPD
jgi:hypothetical protein